MRFMFKAALAFALAFWVLGKGWAAAPQPDLENILYIDLKDGRVAIQLRPDLAPQHVRRMKELAREGFYDGLKFHRVIDGFMAQTGDPNGDGTGGSNYPDLSAEFSEVSFDRGTVGAARTSDPDSANSQFFICLAPAPHLDRQYTVWGQVIRGMRHVDALKKGDPAVGGAVQDPDVIVKMVVAADADDHSVLTEAPDPANEDGKPIQKIDRGSFR